MRPLVRNGILCLFSPGFVGGHCIGVDPYYLTYQSAKKGYIPKVILSEEELMILWDFFITQRIKKLLKQKNQIKKINVLILGFTFKENCLMSGIPEL